MVYENIKTGIAISRKIVQDESIKYKGRTLILETDTDGYVTYTNRRFVEISGYDKDEIIGLPHCIHMHPDMPKDIFIDACQMTSEGKTWRGYIKNITKEGIGYWTDTSIQPKLSDENKIIGYMAIRREPDDKKIIHVIDEYKKLNSVGYKGEKSQYCGEEYISRGTCNF